ncbi:hypothetical protein [Streptomyces lushanensis]|uniref:hypothetical protein n=1 Tax=Streptomyces lushanensis TaxID=1434255 RepID=UPI003CCC003B
MLSTKTIDWDLVLPGSRPVQPRGATGSHAQDLIDAAQQSFVDGRQQAMRAGVAAMAALLVHIALRGPKNTAPLRPDAEAAPESATTGNVAAR